MPTMKDLLSQRIYEVPDQFRESFGSLEIKYNLAITICAASLFVRNKLAEEDKDHPLTAFATDRVGDITAQMIETNDNTVNLACDLDTFTFMRFSCEEAITRMDDFLGFELLNHNERTSIEKNLNQCAIALTATIAVAITSES